MARWPRHQPGNLRLQNKRSKSLGQAASCSWAPSSYRTSESFNGNCVQACKWPTQLTIDTNDPCWFPLAAARCILPLIVLTVVNWDLIYSTFNSRHDYFKTRFAEVILGNSVTGIAEIQLSTKCHGFLYAPSISTNGSPFAVMEDFNPTLKRICTTSDANLCQINNFKKLCLQKKLVKSRRSKKGATYVLRKKTVLYNSLIQSFWSSSSSLKPYSCSSKHQRSKQRWLDLNWKVHDLCTICLFYVHKPCINYVTETCLFISFLSQ